MRHFTLRITSLSTLGCNRSCTATKRKHNLSSISSSISSCSFSTTTSIIDSASSALRVLKLDHKPNYTTYDLRDAYFNAAKLCHPDSNNNNNHKNNKNINKNEDEYTLQFLQITEAYEYLQNVSKNRQIKNNNDNDSIFIIHKSEEENYRNACREVLGLDAETVEESKRCPLFREWLKGKTDAAYHWNRFFMVNGGLAPMLNEKKVLKLVDGLDYDVDSGLRRRRRKTQDNHKQSC